MENAQKLVILFFQLENLFPLSRPWNSIYVSHPWDHGAWRTMKLYPGSSYTWVWCDSCVGWAFYLFLGFICRTGFFCRWVRCLTVLRPKEDPTNHPKSVHRHLSLHPTAGLLGSLPSWTPFTVSKCVGRRAIRRPICPASFSDARHPKKIRYWRIVGFINFG